jgi:hypothetical protein
MPRTLLPAPTDSVIVVLPNVIDQKAQLTKTIRRINKERKGPLPPKTDPTTRAYEKYLGRILSWSSANWLLCTLHLPKSSILSRWPDPLMEALYNHQLIHVYGRVLHVDLACYNEISFRLTTETIGELMEYYTLVHSRNTTTNTGNQLSTFVHITSGDTLNDLHDDGAGELGPSSGSVEVKDRLLLLMDIDMNF